MSKAGRMIGVQTPWYRFGLWLQGYGSVRVLWLGVGHGVLRFVGVLGPRNPKTKALTSKPPRKFAARTLLTPRSGANLISGHGQRHYVLPGYGSTRFKLSGFSVSSSE